MISIIIPVYNQAKKLLKTLDSLLKQGYQDYEVIIVNDGSQDGVEEAFSRYSKSLPSDRSFLFINQANAGAPAARNRGYQEAKGEYLLFCDADACLRPEALETMLSNLQAHPEASYVYSSFYWGKKLFKLGPFDPDRLQREPYIHTISLLRRKDFPADGWDVNIKKFQDWDLWLTMLAAGKIGYWIPETLFQIMPGGTISTWLPRFAYEYLTFLPAVKRYLQARQIIKQKHGL
jgi:glycosyltransferase involved in cell wall biosynthesis